MYYPIGWHKVLKLDIGKCELTEQPNRILQIQGNHEGELFFILTSVSIHIWFPKPAAEIACHKRSKESIGKIGFNKSAIWKTDSSVIVVATERDQLLFYQIKKRESSSTTSPFLLSTSLNGGDGIYRLKFDPKNTKKMLNGQLPPDTSESDQIPALTMFSFGKLDLSSIGVSCLTAAEEELVVGSRDGDIYGILWAGNVDYEFPWSLSREVQARGDYLIDLKISSVLAGFVFVFKSGQIGFMPLRQSNLDHDGNIDLNSSSCDTNISYLPKVNNALCAEINHRHRLVAFGLQDSKIIVCNIGENQSSLAINHTLQLDSCSFPVDTSKLGTVKTMSYSPDNAALAVCWSSGELAIWSVFGSLLFCSHQWQQECDSSAQIIKSLQIRTLAWGREGYNLWMCNQVGVPSVTNASLDRNSTMTDSMTTTLSGDNNQQLVPVNSNNANFDQVIQDQVVLMPLAHCNLTSSPHSTCSSDCIVLMTDEKIFVGPSVPHEDKFDHWIVIDLAQTYIRSQHPIRYAVVDRGCKKLAISGQKGIALYSIGDRKWRLFSKKTNENAFSVCGDLIWWRDYLIASCFNSVNQSHELRAYATSEVNGSLDEAPVTIQSIRLEIARMSVFENRLLVLYVDGTLGMFMLNLRRKPTSLRNNKRVSLVKMRSNSVVADIQVNTTGRLSNNTMNRSDSVSSHNPQSDNSSFFKNVVLHISPIENLIISNLQANSFCISSIALTRLHFKNNRQDDSILLNACGKLFLLEREALPDRSIDPTPGTPSNNSPTAPDIGNLRDLSLDSNSSFTATKVDEAIKINSPKALANSVHLASASLRTTTLNEPGALSNVIFRAVTVIATNVEQFWISPEISSASEMSYFRRSLWLLCGNNLSKASNGSGETRNNTRYLKVWLPLLNDKNDLPNDLYVPDRIMLPIRCDIYPLAIRSSSIDELAENPNISPDDAIVLGAESDLLFRDCKLFTYFPYTTVKRQCRIYLHRILRELLLNQHLGYYAKKIAESCQSLPYFAHCFELLLHEVLEEEATSPVPLPDPMLPQVVKFIRQFPRVYLETVVHCARKSELSMWSHLFDERAVGNPRRLFHECLEKQKLDTAASCLIILHSLDRNIVSSRMVKELMRTVKENENFNYLVADLESFLSRTELDRNFSESPSSTG